MGQVVRDSQAMVSGMSPRRAPGLWAFHSLGEAVPDLSQALATFREDEGLSALLPAEPGAEGAMAQITLDVYSALDGVGLTAAVSDALMQAGIPCNMIAAHHHDHVFVPEAMADRALDVLNDRAADAAMTTTK